MQAGVFFLNKTQILLFTANQVLLIVTQIDYYLFSIHAHWRKYGEKHPNPINHLSVLCFLCIVKPFKQLQL